MQSAKTTLCCSLAVAFLSAAAPPAGRWEGSVDIPQARMNLVIDLAQNAEGRWGGSAIAPGLGVVGAQLADVVVKENEVTFSIANALGSPKLQGKINGDGTLTGTCEEGGRSAAFDLKRTGEPQVEWPKLNTPLTKELEGNWEGAFEMAGSKAKVRILLSNGVDGRGTGEISLGESSTAKGPLERILQDGDDLTANATSFGLVFEAHYKKDGDELTGVLRQGGLELPLVLRRVVKK
jgi:hypothetical protein